ncbi:aspartate ammonia-lyase [Galactobacter valiniphilus]|uniref:Aspartate ammonia-lyase n=1 Tax=Galactobacter valiniphilus TaxID=2676122 RepID=A0A399J762_9MICC|nr:aspartate ammonia-lyase [Galactobacter valiniphilus]RII41353.1 aspartate ammonia-lyase [Galactobacter valiniphilus]
MTTPATAGTRVEKDSLGSREVPNDVLWGISTLRAMENFPITGRPIGGVRHLVWALGAIKLAAARANNQLGELDDERAGAIEAAAVEVMDGKWDDQFPIDRVQGGAGTSTNMNANEVIAHRAAQILGQPMGYVDPIDHVNRAQSTNDVYPSALKLALYKSMEPLLTSHVSLQQAFRVKAQDFAQITKIGRTQLQDAVPMTLGQEFGAFADTLSEDSLLLETLSPNLLELNLGATAIGTGITALPEYRPLVLKALADITGIHIIGAANLIEATSDTGVFVLISGALKRAAIKLSKICNDLRLLSSGPQAGFGEINLPAVQAGSSIMPGKVNPVIPEVVNQVAFRIVGADNTVAFAVEAGQLQLNAFEPVMADVLFDAVESLTNACATLETKCVVGITANEELLARRVAESVSVVTALSPLIGYAKSAELMHRALDEKRGLLELAIEDGVLDAETIKQALAAATGHTVAGE